MKEWFFSLICIGLLGITSRLLLPGGEKSKLYPPLSFLFSLILIITVFSPLYKLFHQEKEIYTDFFSSLESPDTKVMERMLLERSAKEMSNQIKTQFPEAEFTLYIYTDKNGTPTEIFVKSVCGDAKDIADYIEAKYSISADEYNEGENENGSVFN